MSRRGAALALLNREGNPRIVSRLEPKQDLDQLRAWQGDTTRCRRAGSDMEEDRAAQAWRPVSVIGDDGRVVVCGYLMQRLGISTGVVFVRINPLVVARTGRVIVPVVVGVCVPEGEGETQVSLYAKEEADPVRP